MKQPILLIEKDTGAGSEAGECCIPTSTSTLLQISSSQVRQTAELFGILADPTRLTILNLLAASQSGEVCVCDVTASFQVGQPTISHHLKILRDAGVIQGDKRGKWVYYSLVKSRVAEIRSLLDRVLEVPAL